LLAFIAPVMALAQALPPALPYQPEQYPGADFRSLTCPRGPAQPSSPTVDAHLLAFIADVQGGEARPRYLYRYFPVEVLPNSTRFFIQVGKIQKLEFREAYVACADMLARAKISPSYRPSVIYVYNLIGTSARTGLLIVTQDGVIMEFHQKALS
jgi:hypothetical protein